MGTHGDDVLLEGGIDRLRKLLTELKTSIDDSRRSDDIRAVIAEIESFIEHIASSAPEQELEESREKYRALVESSLEGIVIFQDSQFVFANNRMLEIIGLTADEIQSLSIDELIQYIHPEDRQAVAQRLRARFAGEDLKSLFSFRLRTNGNEEKWLESLGARITISGKPAIQITVRDITERVKAEEALRASEEMSEALLNATTEMVVLIDREGIILDVNFAYAGMFNMSRESMIGMCVWDTFPADLSARRKKNGERVFRTGEPFRGQDERGGRYFDWVLHPVKDRAGNTECVAVFSRDVTDIKRAERNLRKSEEFNKTVIERSPMGVSVRSRTGQLLSCNRAWRKIWGFSDDVVTDFMTRPRKSLKLDEYDEYLGHWANEVKTIYTEGGYLHIPEARVLNPRPESAEWVSQYFYAIHGEDGEVDRVVILTEDISDRRRVADALQVSVRQWQTTFDAIGDSVCLVNQQGIIQQCNKATQTLFGIPLQQVVGRECRELLFGDAPVPDECDLEEMMTTRTRKNIALQIGDRWLRITIDPIIEDKGNRIGAVNIISDITEQKRAEEALKDAHEQLNLEHLALSEKNIALTQVLDHIEEEKRIARAQVADKVEQVLLPALSRLVRTDGTVNDNYFDLMKRGLAELVSGGGDIHKILTRLSPREAEICNMIICGLSSQEIADTLCVSLATVKKHRENIRKKLKLTKKGMNLVNFLKSNKGAS